MVFTSLPSSMVFNSVHVPEGGFDGPLYVCLTGNPAVGHLGTGVGAADLHVPTSVPRL